MAATPGRVYVNSTYTIKGQFRDADGDYADPDTITMTLRSPSGTATTYTQGTDDEIERVDTGIYNADVYLDESGRWFWRWSGTLDGVLDIYAAVEGSIVVQSSPHFDDPTSDYGR